MFQYAFFKQMQYWHGAENVKLDIDTFHWKSHNGLEIDKIFSIDFTNDKADISQSIALADVGRKIHQRALRKLRGVRHKNYKFWKDLNYEDYKHLSGDIYLEGYWNEEKYFESVKDYIKNIYTFPKLKNNYHNEILQQIESTESVGIHVRRGDYIKFPDSFPMCTPEFYFDALEIIKKNHPTLKCFVFSDDIEWCKKELSALDNPTFVENNVKTEAFIDMMLMSKCKHNIIANSTFSWWSAWLNDNPEKVVIYPEKTSLTYASMPLNWECL